MQNGEPFELNINGLMLKVTGHIINNTEVFRIEFSDSRPPLIITEAMKGSKMGHTYYWTSLPQGRLKEAGFFGAKIAEHFKKK